MGVGSYTSILIELLWGSLWPNSEEKGTFLPKSPKASQLCWDSEEVKTLVHLPTVWEREKGGVTLRLPTPSLLCVDPEPLALSAVLKP